MVVIFFLILIMVIVFSYVHVVNHGCPLLVFMLLIMVVTSFCVPNHFHCFSYIHPPPPHPCAPIHVCCYLLCTFTPPPPTLVLIMSVTFLPTMAKLQMVKLTTSKINMMKLTMNKVNMINLTNE
jgi:hypothetical protein